MSDDYQYQSTVLPAKNGGLFGLGGRPNEGSAGFSGSIIDGGSGANGANGDPGLQGVQGLQGPPGEPGLLVDGVLGDMLYHNGYNWVTLSNSTMESRILRTGGIYTTPQWRPAPIGAGIVYQTDTDDLEALAGFTYGDMLFWDTNNWAIIPAAEGEGTFVLASNGGTPYWIPTESCDTPPE
jgi:hypothetical protein